MEGSLVEFVLTVFSAMLLQTWYLHREIRRSREESMRHTDRSHDQLLIYFGKSHDQLRTDFGKSHDQLRTDFTEHKVITERNHRETQRQFAKLGEGLGDTRKRLARIEGYLRIGLPEPPEAVTSG